ncbi:MAG: SWIM zinc finger family protein, partial [Bradymonadaceae bacterium]
KISPQLLAALTEAAPGRLVRKLDKEPELAKKWNWVQEEGTWAVETDSDERVRLGAKEVLVESDDISCTCLLAPRCLHILAVANVLELEEGQAGEETVEEPSREESAEVVELGEGRQAAARALWEAGVVIVDQGAMNASMNTISELLRAVHTGRIAGLHRASAAGLRVAQWVRHLQRKSSEFELEGLREDLKDLLRTAWMLMSLEVGAEGVSSRWVGTARRKYQSRGGMRLHGLLCEPVIAKSGYGGVVVTLADGGGVLWTISDVQPGGPERVRGAYTGAIAIGDVSMAPRELSRSGLFLQHAATSPDGRLSLGKNVRAVTSKVGDWSGEEVRALWDAPLTEQLDRAWTALCTSVPERPAGSDLLFIRGQVLGADGDALVLAAQPGGGEQTTPVRIVAPLIHETLHYRDNLRVLARAPGLSLSLVGRVIFDAPREVAGLAVSSEDMSLPESWQGRCNLGLDRLQTGYLSKTEEHPTLVAGFAGSSATDPLDALRRRTDRLIYGGRMTLRAQVRDAIEQEAALLERRMMRHGARVLRGLADAGAVQGRAWTGERQILDPNALGRAWLTATLFEEAARRMITRSQW